MENSPIPERERPKRRVSQGRSPLWQNVLLIVGGVVVWVLIIAWFARLLSPLFN